MYFLSSLRGQTAKTLICTKSGVSADSRKSAKKYRKVRRTALFGTFYTLFAQKVRFSALFRYFLALFLESAETPLLVQINVFAVWPLRLDRKYTTLVKKHVPCFSVDEAKSSSGSLSLRQMPKSWKTLENKAVTWSGYEGDRQRKNFLEVLLPTKHCKTRPK